MGVAAGCVGTERQTAFEEKRAALGRARDTALSCAATPNELAKHGFKINQDGVRRTAMDLMAYPDVTIDRLTDIWPALAEFSPAVREQLEIEGKYASYLDRQEPDIRSYRNDESLKLPVDLDYDAIGGLSTEIKTKLAAAQPATLGAAARISGVTPAALTALLGHVQRSNKAAA